jgi:puromycin-sensitive aminopeptidase
MKNKKQFKRLSTCVVPVRYNITLKPDLEARTFVGNEDIDISLTQSCKDIIIHSKDLHIQSVFVSTKNKRVPGRVFYDEQSETILLSFEETVLKGKATLHFSFSGVLTDTMRGFYMSQYVVNGEQRTMATTQFEATDARRAFPCFDEPSHKAIFDIHLIVPVGLTAISNTLPVTIAEHEAGYKMVSFASTPKMSTYLVACIVGDFEALEVKTKRGVLVRVLTVPGKVHQGAFALDVTVRCLEYFEQYFGIPYPLNTLDMIAIPDFSSIAMENWGAITFREIGLLVDEDNSSTATRQMVALVIAHELAHQWFGNLVTMEWWTHLWLNEGFATYIEHLAVDALFPEYDVWSQFATGMSGHGLAHALKLDALSTTHPVEVPVHHPNEIGEVFDRVSYDKGATVIRMLAEYLGEKDFRNGLRHYLKKHTYKNTQTEDLWDAFEHISKKPVRKMMSVWTGKSGYPLLTFVKHPKKGISVSQKRFYSSVKSAQKSTDTTLWPVPVATLSIKGEKQHGLLSKRTQVIPENVDSWIKANARETALYRTKYEGALLGALVEPISTKLLSPVDRLGIIRDLFALAQSGEVSTATVLEMVSVYKQETSYAVWVEIISGLRTILNLAHETSSYDALRSYSNEIISQCVETVGWDAVSGESHDTALLRSLVLGFASTIGNELVIKEALFRYKNRKTTPIHPDLRGFVYATYVRMGGEKEFNEIYSAYSAESLHEEKLRYLHALGAVQNKKLIQKLLSMTLTDTVRMQDRNGVFSTVLAGYTGREIAWNFLQKQWKRIGEAYGDGNHLLSRLVESLNRFTTKEAYKSIATFFKTHSAPSAERTVTQTLEQIDSNVRWLARDGKKIAQWLKNR